MLNLKKLRECKAVSQKEIADFINKSIQAYSLYETGKREPDLETLCKLSDFFNVSIDYLLGRDTSYPHKAPKEKTPPPSLKGDESEMLDLYNKLDKEGKTGVLHACYQEIRRMKEEQAAAAAISQSAG